jgi:hypothetical protein
MIIGSSMCCAHASNEEMPSGAIYVAADLGLVPFWENI